MKKTLLLFFYVTAMLCMGLVTTSIADGRPLPPGNVGDNIALGKNYTLSPAPNYSYCTDPGDITQLTDGTTWTGSSFWVQTSTVGWVSVNPTIVIDLGHVQPIQQISFYTAAGGGGSVQWPTAINMSVSNDGINYYNAGDLVSLSNTQHNDAPPPPTIYSLHCYDASLQTHGRYVKIDVIRQGYYVFVDEIKIYRGDNSYLGQNIAGGRSYTLSLDPNYPYCTDSGDATQLTDNSYTSGNKLWEQAGCVGWKAPSSSPTIIIDLGQIQPIEGIGFNTAAGSADVNWPMAISVLVSDNGVDYYDAGELVSRSSEHGLPLLDGYLVHFYWTDRLATRGRYVKIMPVANGYYLFVDEIEVYQGNNGMLTQPSRGGVVSDMTNYMKKNQIRAGTARRIVFDAQNAQIQTDAQTGLTQAVRDQIKTLLSTSLNEAMYLPDSDPALFQAVLPLNYPANITHARVFRALSKLWQAQGKTGLIAWQTSSSWDPLYITQSPQTGSNPEINVRMLQNEYRAAAFNLSNASDNDLTVSLNIQGLPGGTNPSYITVHEVSWTDTRKVVAVASALPVAATNANGYVINIPAGMTRQVWLTFHPTITNPGIYSGTIVVNGGTVGMVNIPVVFDLSCLGFSAQPMLSLGGYDYTNSTFGGMTLQNRAAFITHLREHFVDTTWGTSAVMPNPPVFTNFDAWATRWTDVRNYRIYLAVGNTFNGYLMGTPEFNAAVASWINTYVAHWQGKGLNLNQIALHLVDEPYDSINANIVIEWANAIHAAQPNLKIWNDPTFSDPSENYAQLMFQSVDILCLQRTPFIVADEVYRDVFRQQRTAGKILDFYSCYGPFSSLDPYSYYRLQAWTCFKENAVAMHYWTFSGEASWNEYCLIGCNDNYGPFFLGNTVMTAGKPMEAIREGVEDYEYLVMLKNRITELGGNAEAQALLDGAASAVLNATDASQMNWANTKDRSIADQKRIEVLNMLEALGPQTGDNIAKGRTYTLSPTPNYSYCTDSGDISQLTDGIYSTIPIWTKLPTVGWYGNGTATITIDLGSVQTIQGVAFSTAGGISGVQWPTAIDMSVSNNGANYSSIGELVGISNSEHGDAPTYGTYQAHRYWTKSLSPSNGRYVKIIVLGSPYKFADEIEIYRN